MANLGILLSLYPIYFRADALHTSEKSAETRLVREMKLLSDGGDGEVGRIQQPRSLHEQHLVNIVDHRATRHLPNNA